MVHKLRSLSIIVNNEFLVTQITSDLDTQWLRAPALVWWQILSVCLKKEVMLHVETRLYAI